jgi:hypothetical protein
MIFSGVIAFAGRYDICGPSFRTVLDFFTEYFGLYVVPFLRLGLGLGFMCANKKQKYDGHIHLQ